MFQYLITNNKINTFILKRKTICFNIERIYLDALLL